MIRVCAIITAKPGKRADLIALFRGNMPAVHAEAGCVEYEPVVDQAGMGNAQFGADTFVVWEKWASADHLKAHAAAPHMAAYAAASKELIASRVIHVLAPA